MDQLPDPKRRKIRDVVFDILRTADLKQPQSTLIAEPPQQEADVSLPDGRLLDPRNNSRVICKLSDERSVGLVDIQGNPFVSSTAFMKRWKAGSFCQR
ncbi:hypothetical protein HAX54_002053 [Datura stramonium]|uniref:Uncharacterized protein n=1 Tax=Datura stramonium TaxID=4076 RepID=A0ABS8T5G0_DATST|nr:hypothetical protein [Datura stramonium]